ncbi:phage major capsid protein [Alteraurantiacibacter palmitatis]|uniref:Phage major capsid protein n=1 Tax=Alteraurantiacibacter palmitatis TaxID=2054628 RepID=A0ABV7E5Y8_9SPHN
MKTANLLEQGRTAAPFEQKDGLNLPADPADAINKLAEAFVAFKSSHAEEVAEIKKKGAVDPLLTERLSKIDTALNTFTEAKTALESSIAAERKEREDLELRLQRMNVKGDGDAAKAELELKEFNQAAKSMAAARQRPFEPVDAKSFDEYKAAWDKLQREGKDALSADELKAMSVGSDKDGGYLVTPDTNGRMVRKVFETSPIRQIANVQVISSDKLEGDYDLDEAGAGWVGETQSRIDTDTPEIGSWEIPVHEMFAQPKATQQLLDDASVNIENWLGDKVGQRFGRLENTAFVSGNGARKPRGFAAYPTLEDDGSGVAWGSIGFVKSGANGAFLASAQHPADRLYDLIGALKEAYLPGARFVTRRTVLTAVRKIKATDGHYLWQPSFVLGQPEMLAGFPITRAEDIAALGNDSLSLWFGDFNEAYQIVDRLGTRVLRDPYTDKPFVKFYSIRRTGGAVVNFEAIKAMKFAA